MKKSRILWIILLLCNIGLTKAQVLKLENGFAISSTKIPHTDYNKNIYPYQVSIGLDYMDRGWYDLSSSVGYLRKGSKDIIHVPSVIGIDAYPFTYNFDYITLNTTFRIKKTTHDHFTFYAGAGPRADIRLDSRLKGPGAQFFFPSDQDFEGRSLIIGLKTEVGIYYQFSRYQLGVNFSYLPSFNRPLGQGGMKERTFTGGVVLGYVL